MCSTVIRRPKLALQLCHPSGSYAHKCGLQASRISITQKLVRNAEFQAPPQTCWIKICLKIPRWSVCTVKSEKHCSRALLSTMSKRGCWHPWVSAGREREEKMPRRHIYLRGLARKWPIWVLLTFHWRKLSHMFLVSTGFWVALPRWPAIVLALQKSRF